MREHLAKSCWTHRPCPPCIVAHPWHRNENWTIKINLYIYTYLKLCFATSKFHRTVVWKHVQYMFSDHDCHWSWTWMTQLTDTTAIKENCNLCFNLNLDRRTQHPNCSKCLLACRVIFASYMHQVSSIVSFVCWNMCRLKSWQHCRHRTTTSNVPAPSTQPTVSQPTSHQITSQHESTWPLRNSSWAFCKMFESRFFWNAHSSS